MDIQNNPSGIAGGLSIQEYLDQDEKKDLLRLLTAGSVDDGKSTLIGRLLFDSKKLYEDQLSALERDSKRVGNAGAGEIDYALLLDGLKAEREQGITIDVAYRYFSTNRRKFIIADTPGHEQYTRNMITGGSTASLAILLVDARTGVITQTRRHTFLCSLLGIKTIALAVNKMDLVDFDEAVYRKIVADYMAFVSEITDGTTRVQCFPLSAKEGDNVVEKSERTPWYDGPALLDFLETVEPNRPTPCPSLRGRGEGTNSAEKALEDGVSTPLPHREGSGAGLPFRFPVQYVLRPNLDFRGFCGKVASGVIRKGDAVMALPSGKKSRVKSIVTYEGELDYAFAPQCVTLTLEDEIDISRGEMIVKINDDRPTPAPSLRGRGEVTNSAEKTFEEGVSTPLPHREGSGMGLLPHVGRHFEAHLVWMDEERMDRSKSFFIKQTTNTSRCRIDHIKYKVDVNTLEHSEVEALQLNEIGRVVITTAKELMYDAYAENRQTGAFVVIDPITNNTAAVGMIVGPVEETDLRSGDLALPTLDLPALGITAEHYAAIDAAVESLRKQGLEVKVVK